MRSSARACASIPWRNKCAARDHDRNAIATTRRSRALPWCDIDCHIGDLNTRRDIHYGRTQKKGGEWIDPVSLARIDSRASDRCRAAALPRVGWLGGAQGVWQRAGDEPVIGADRSCFVRGDVDTARGPAGGSSPAQLLRANSAARSYAGRVATRSLVSAAACGEGASSRRSSPASTFVVTSQESLPRRLRESELPPSRASGAHVTRHLMDSPDGFT